MRTLAFRRRDPWWGLEGPAARRRHRRQRIVSILAFLVSVAALVGAGMAWAIQIGVAAVLGLNVQSLV